MDIINGTAQAHPPLLLPTWFPSLSQHLLMGMAAVLFYVLSVRARRDRRAPAAAISWVLGLALLPYLVLPMYSPVRAAQADSEPAAAASTSRSGGALGRHTAGEFRAGPAQ